MDKPTPTRQTRIRQNSAERRERSRQDTRQAILKAAIAMFNQQGYEGFSLRQVAESIGYTPTTIYLYFKDKEDLLFAVCSQGFMEFTQTLQNAYNSTDHPLERIRALAWAYFNFGINHPLHYQVMFMRHSDWVLKASNNKGDVQGSASFMIQMNAVIEAMKAGSIRMGDPIERTNLLWSGIHGVVSLALNMKGVAPKWEEAEAKRLLEDYLEVVERGLKP